MTRLASHRARVERLLAGRKEPYPAQYDARAIEIIERVKPYTMVHPEKLFALIQAVRYVDAHRIPGAIVECGVWRGGCMMAAALALRERGTKDVEFYLFDTFEGMSKPTERDKKHTGEASIHEFTRRQTGPDSADWCRATLDDVRQNLSSIDYDQRRFHLVKGKVEDTIPNTIPEKIALLLKHPELVVAPDTVLRRYGGSLPTSEPAAPCRRGSRETRAVHAVRQGGYRRSVRTHRGPSGSRAPDRCRARARACHA